MVVCFQRALCTKNPEKSLCAPRACVAKKKGPDPRVACRLRISTIAGQGLGVNTSPQCHVIVCRCSALQEQPEHSLRWSNDRCCRPDSAGRVAEAERRGGEPHTTIHSPVSLVRRVSLVDVRPVDPRAPAPAPSPARRSLSPHLASPRVASSPAVGRRTRRRTAPQRRLAESRDVTYNHQPSTRRASHPSHPRCIVLRPLANTTTAHESR